MFKIGEFSKLVRVSPRMLRHYEKCGLLTPAEIDRFTGYRLYSAAQIPLLTRIITLRDMGFGVDDIEALLPSFGDVKVMREALSKKQGEIHAAILSEQNKLEKIAAISGKLETECLFMVHEVEFKSLPAVHVLSLREIIKSPEDETMLWIKLGEFAKNNGIDPNVCGYSVYHDDEYKETDVDVEISIPVPAFGKDDGNFVFKELSAMPSAATIRFSGSYEGYNEAMEKLALWIESNDYEVSGSVRGHSVVFPGEDVPMEDYLTELQVPVKKR